MNEQKFYVGTKALILNDENKILILKANPKELKGNCPAHWDLPGGRIKIRETPEESLRKEVKEELGIEGKEIKIVRLFDASISNLKIPVGDESFGLVLFTYFCKFKRKNVKFNLSFEHTEYKWVSIKEARKLLSFKFHRNFIENLDNLLLDIKT